VLTQSDTELRQQVNVLTAKNLELHEELRWKAKELSDMKEEMEKQRRYAEAALKVQTDRTVVCETVPRHASESSSSSSSSFICLETA